MRRTDRQGAVLMWCSKMFGTCEAKKGMEADKLLQTGTDGHQSKRQDVEDNSNV